MCVFFLDLSSEFPSFNLILPGTIYYSMQLVINTGILYSMHCEHLITKVLVIGHKCWLDDNISNKI